MLLVFTTSIGVVKKPAVVPAIAPFIEFDIPDVTMSDSFLLDFAAARLIL
jgi:hypothetical protein